MFSVSYEYKLPVISIDGNAHVDNSCAAACQGLHTAAADAAAAACKLLLVRAKGCIRRRLPSTFAFTFAMAMFAATTSSRSSIVAVL
jgi:hypothetical protein